MDGTRFFLEQKTQVDCKGWGKYYFRLGELSTPVINLAQHNLLWGPQAEVLPSYSFICWYGDRTYTSKACALVHWEFQVTTNLSTFSRVKSTLKHSAREQKVNVPHMIFLNMFMLPSPIRFPRPYRALECSTLSLGTCQAKIRRLV